MLLCCIIPSSSGKTNAMLQEVARRISGTVAGEVYAKVNIPSTHHIPLSPTLHYLQFASRFPLPTSPLPFYSPSLSLSSLSICLFLPVCFLFARGLDCLFVAMAQDNTKLCDFSNTNNNDFISTPIAPITNAESCEINAALLNLVMKDPFSGLPSEDAATHLNSFVDLRDTQKKKDVDNDIVKLKLFPFSLRNHAKAWFSSLPKNSIDSWNN